MREALGLPPRTAISVLAEHSPTPSEEDLFSKIFPGLSATSTHNHPNVITPWPYGADMAAAIFALTQAASNLTPPIPQQQSLPTPAATPHLPQTIPPQYAHQAGKAKGSKGRFHPYQNTHPPFPYNFQPYHHHGKGKGKGHGKGKGGGRGLRRIINVNIRQ